MGQRLKYLFLFVTGGLLYNLLELFYRGWTHGITAASQATSWARYAHSFLRYGCRYRWPASCWMTG